MSLGDSDSYYEDFETNNLPKQKKVIPTPVTYLHYLKIVQKITIMEQ